MTEYVNQASFDQFLVADIDGLPYLHEYSYEAEVPVRCDEAFDLWMKHVWLADQFSLENEGQGGGREGSIRRMGGGLVRETLVQVGCPDNQRIASAQYTILILPLPFHDYKGFIQFIPQGDNSTLVKWSGKLAPKRWDYNWFGGRFCWPVLLLFRTVVGDFLNKFTRKVSHLTENKKQHISLRTNALIKLSKILPQVAGPRNPEVFPDLDFSADSYLANRWKIEQSVASANIVKIGTKVNKEVWQFDVSAQTVNAFYYPSLNRNVIPAAILQPPFLYHGRPNLVITGL
ncbi:hypothetical protein Ae201684P_000504 [Aphanomyces euteiches]|uniref:Uncharacterized protein n=1 Tax=Aphanomyces euteiches TaxID=100861 RepID=A0A6G0XR36_9STRA|nr:hypothetical protein Ae201684_002075 [Aphanomyces euteiches]KAH9087092.1 hypothetical protein Ae201684P_000504 [Aphanomyces euteiches]KAH9139557.1 hypothetical protein AeRB84_016179 [Aphanomyces euteiches]